jgi:hypothetical protein
MRAPFGVARVLQEQERAENVALTERGPTESPYGLVPYSKLGSSPRAKPRGRPGTGLGGGIGIRKLSKLDVKE